MIEFETTDGKPVFVQPEHVAAVETASGGVMKVARSNIRVLSGHHYEVEGTPREVVTKLFPTSYSVQRLSPEVR